MSFIIDQEKLVSDQDWSGNIVSETLIRSGMGASLINKFVTNSDIQYVIKMYTMQLFLNKGVC